MYVAGQSHPLKQSAEMFLESVSGGKVDGCTSTEVLQEILYRYVALNRRDLAHEVYELFAQLCPVVLPVTLSDMDRAKQLLAAKSKLAVRDCVHAAVMINNDISTIATFDRAFDSIDGIDRYVFP